MDPSNTQVLATHYGGCHCKRVRWKIQAPKSIVAWNCNCSLCSKRRNVSFSVPSNRFTLLSGESDITTYTFGTHTAKHTFCSVCGITSFNVSRANPQAVSVNVTCVDPGTVDCVEVRCYDGVNWEDTNRKYRGGDKCNNKTK